MQIFNTSCYIALIFVVFWSSCSREKTMGETCLSLYTPVAQSSTEGPGQFNYEKYADLKVPPLPPDEALKKFELEEGFRIELVASEPMIADPVAMDIDADGRLWVVDMPSYMPVANMDDWETAAREQIPKGRVLVLEDTTGDGVMDTRRIFRDELILPRAIKVLNDGILVGEPPNVWFIYDSNGDGKGDSRIKVYDSYGDPNVTNVESLPNGLMWGMDNWIHSADGGAESLRRVDGKWQTRHFERLGQWGMSQDNWGRLYSANNSRPLQTHLVPYGYSERHPEFELDAGINLNISPRQPMWPAHAVGTNRSYRIGQAVREEDGTLLRATSTLGPVIYRGDQFGDDYRKNAFTPEPAANMIKRLIVEGDPTEIEVEARFAYEGREFLTSTDERFRPVNMYNSPDGAMYVVDMYRGIIQHARFLTDHLREYAMERDLHIPYGKFGRIYRIVRDDRQINYNTPKFSQLTSGEIVEFLRHENGLLRDQAQQVLVQCSPDGVSPSLERMTEDKSEKAWTRLQALWTLEGLDRSVYSREQLAGTALQMLEDQHPRIRAAAVRILEPELAENSEVVLDHFKKMAQTEQAPFVRLRLLASLGESDSNTAVQLIASILDKHVESSYFQEMAMTGVHQRESQLIEQLRSEYGWAHDRNGVQDSLLSILIEADTTEADDHLEKLTSEQKKFYQRGRHLYGTCMACHGEQGKGVSGIGPALDGSDWVEGEPDALIRIAINGFEGGVAENFRRAVNISGVMPSHSFLSDQELAAILTYIRQSWGNRAEPIEPEEVARIRAAVGDRDSTWSPEELRELN